MVADEEVQRVTRTRDQQNLKRPTVTGLLLPGDRPLQESMAFKIGLHANWGYKQSIH